LKELCLGSVLIHETQRLALVDVLKDLWWNPKEEPESPQEKQQGADEVKI
jgi:hypothetical protein